MKITWIGHSCFKIEKDGHIIVLDPYEDGSVPGYAPVREAADLVLCSHGHRDHNAKESVTLKETSETPFEITKSETFHDNARGTQRGLNTIHIISDGETRIAHFGDLGCKLETEQIEMLKELDVALIPVGGYFTIDAAQAAELVAEINPRIVIPMHYSNAGQGLGYDVIGPVEKFTELMPDVMTVPTCEIDSSMELSSQVVVLQAQNSGK